MLDIKRIREDFDGVKKAVESRGKGDFGIDKVREYDVERRKLLAEVEQMKNQQSTSSRQIPVLKKEGKDTTELMAEMKQLSEKIKVLDGQVSEVEAKLRDALLNIPNTPYKDVQEGADDSDNVELRKWGEPRTFDFDEKRVLTMRGKSRSVWKEIPALMPENLCGNHRNSAKNEGIQYSGIWQEKVLVENKISTNWAKSLFS